MLTGGPDEIAGPSDGVVFIDSCAAEDGVGSALWPWNHPQRLLTWPGE